MGMHPSSSNDIHKHGMETLSVMPDDAAAKRSANWGRKRSRTTTSTVCNESPILKAPPMDSIHRCFGFQFSLQLMDILLPLNFLMKSDEISQLPTTEMTRLMLSRRSTLCFKVLQISRPSNTFLWKTALNISWGMSNKLIAKRPFCNTLQHIATQKWWNFHHEIADFLSDEHRDFPKRGDTRFRRCIWWRLSSSIDEQSSHVSCEAQVRTNYGLQNPSLNLSSVNRREVLLVGDGTAMRFWPMWPFYRYLNRTYGNQIGGGLQRKAKFTLVTPETPNFNRGMHIADAIHRFCISPDPVVYFLVRFYVTHAAGLAN